MRTQRCWGLFLLSAGLFWLATAKSCAQHYDIPIPIDTKRLVSMRESGRHRDPKAVPDLIAVLTEQPPVNTSRTNGYSLSHADGRGRSLAGHRGLRSGPKGAGY
jgi:hypothetical protein